ncbi:tyrosine-protein phosphatase [Vagococcus elongatus]|uniref:Tyrosine specific protein phosphatases domain-containing protein n=1 Tax=Vagococcus elongatus TaxID=180344 RepID=A0A430AML8_9ENTE|nr:tyrosine-protein phosphatase [Vagococcus elongatus]RSU09203.1 hypothetical protein CBF29_12095 [Vagococcus elongatus]
MKTLTNFRDIGGYETQSGRKIKKNLMFRSGEISRLSKKDHQAFEKDFGIQTIFDFRGEDEKLKSPNDSFERVQTVNLDICKDSNGNSASMEDLIQGKTDPDSYMKDLYKDFIFTDSSRQGYRTFLEHVSELDSPFIFHCFAGKDRTGFGAALLLSIMGVSKSNIYHDYLLTNRLRQKANERILSEMKKNGLNSNELEMVRTMMEVKPAYLDVSFKEIEENYGNVSRFIKDGLDVPKDVVDKIKFQYTE